MKYCFTLLFVVLSLVANAQELFPIEMPASTLPKGTLGIRVFDQAYPEVDIYRNLYALRLMYGITPNLTAIFSTTVSDYHEHHLPLDFISHNHTSSQVIVGTNTPAAGVPYPEIYNGHDLYLQYRFLARDGQNSHFRMAAYAEGSYVPTPSHEAEPVLIDHNSGIGGGAIATYLKKHIAVSLTAGFIIPFTYNGLSYDQYGGVYPTTLHYGNAVNYDLSFGYLLFPTHYKNYKQTNWNVYMEFLGKTYGAASGSQQDGVVTYTLPITTPLLESGNYVDVNPGLQCIIRSNTRIDLSASFHLINQSYTHNYPFYYISFQQYIYFSKRKHRNA